MWKNAHWLFELSVLKEYYCNWEDTKTSWFLCASTLFDFNAYYFKLEMHINVILTRSHQYNVGDALVYAQLINPQPKNTYAIILDRVWNPYVVITVYRIFIPYQNILWY